MIEPPAAATLGTCTSTALPPLADFRYGAATTDVTFTVTGLPLNLSLEGQLVWKNAQNIVPGYTFLDTDLGSSDASGTFVWTQGVYAGELALKVVATPDGHNFFTYASCTFQSQ